MPSKDRVIKKSLCTCFLYCNHQVHTDVSIALYFSLFLFAFILKLQIPKLKHSQIRLCIQVGKKGYQNASVWKGKQLKEFSHWLAGLARWVCPPLALAVLKPTPNVWEGHSPLGSPHRLESVAVVWIWPDFSPTHYNMYVCSNEEFYSDI